MHAAVAVALDLGRSLAQRAAIAQAEALIYLAGRVRLVQGIEVDAPDLIVEQVAALLGGPVDADAADGFGVAAGDATQTALGRAYQTLIAQAGLLAYMDVFLYCALLAFLFVPFTFLFSPVKKAGGAPGGH